MKNVALKSGSYFVLVLGVIISAIILAFSIYVLATAHGGADKKGIVIAICLILVLIVMYGSIILFSTIRGVAVLEEKLDLSEKKIRIDKK